MKRSPAGGPQGWERIWAAGPALTKYWDEPEPAVVEWARGLGPSVRRVLDLGCGVGRHTVLFSRLGPRAVGVDVSPSALAMCVAKMREQGLDPTLVRNDMAWLPFGDGAFDALLSFHVVYHTTSAGLRVILAEIHRVVRPGGQLYLTFLGRVEENISRYRADVARGICQELEPFTFMYLREAPGDKDMPHHYCDEAELRALLADFAIKALVPVWHERTDDDGAHHVSLHYHVQVEQVG